MALWKKNEVKVDIASYMHYIRGVKKVGKTTLFRDLVSHISNGEMDKGLLISLGDEDGYKALDGLMVATASDWSEFVEIVDELVENPEENEFKFIALDTVDELFNIATEEVFRIHKRKKGEVCESLNSALGGYGAGRAKVKELVREQVARLKVGYGLYCIGHTKLRDVNEKGMNEAYQQLTTSLPFDFDSVIADKADIIATISIDKDIVDIQEIANGKDTKRVGSIGGVTRWIHFRDDNFNVDCGARFENIVDKVELSAENYIKAIEDAIRSASGKSDTEIKTKVKQEEQERLEAVKELADKSKEIDIDENKKLAESIQEKLPKASAEVKKVFTAKLKEIGMTSLKEYAEVKTKDLKDAVALLG